MHSKAFCHLSYQSLVLLWAKTHPSKVRFHSQGHISIHSWLMGFIVPFYFSKTILVLTFKIRIFLFTHCSYAYYSYLIVKAGEQGSQSFILKPHPWDSYYGNIFPGCSYSPVRTHYLEIPKVLSWRKLKLCGVPHPIRFRKSRQSTLEENI